MFFERTREGQCTPSNRYISIYSKEGGPATRVYPERELKLATRAGRTSDPRDPRATHGLNFIFCFLLALSRAILMLPWCEKRLHGRTFGSVH